MSVENGRALYRATRRHSTSAPTEKPEELPAGVEGGRAMFRARRPGDRDTDAALAADDDRPGNAGDY